MASWRGQLRSAAPWGARSAPGQVRRGRFGWVAVGGAKTVPAKRPRSRCGVAGPNGVQGLGRHRHVRERLSPLPSLLSSPPRLPAA
eukprot:4918927-Pyramimonas_sp.AAC.1